MNRGTGRCDDDYREEPLENKIFLGLPSRYHARQRRLNRSNASVPRYLIISVIVTCVHGGRGA